MLSGPVGVDERSDEFMATLTRRQAMEIWRGALSDNVRSAAPDLSARQMALLLTVYMMPPPHTVRGLARALNISKPAVTRALDTLGRMDLLRRKRDQADKRNVLVQRTVKGSVFLSEFADSIVTAAGDERVLADPRALPS